MITHFASRLKKGFGISAALISLLTLAGCSTFSSGVTEADRLKNSKTSLEITLDAGYDLNPNDRGEASPLKIRLYELQAADLFSQADFLDLYDQDSASLQDSLIKIHRIPAQRPGQKTQLDFPLDPSTRFIAVLAEFSRYQDADARVIAPIAPEVRNIGYLSMEGNSLFLKITPERTAFDRAKQLFDLFPENSKDDKKTTGAKK
ncbi:type VI secretion system lipoprotein TssJ [Sansalvadorimonas sp. 2012CJ34-2]|uniref:Type VI secretion system lipoprotein TssJ n=1 Tax=Parendozoicomonas callyspongiae TaxID=2942213 RepID=A0ABT0PNV3_9GAMM|nr:type VI secretion system lipoprotein TssJ [Sansalvadorimonas sp. 2012CJ34-2]MCL6272128.1 type VI secretion system lipoprotein TssJ [Sansalvadorimonas sp. 2012CJ34-2]